VLLKAVPPTVIPVIAPLQAASSVKVTSNGASTVALPAAVKVGGVVPVDAAVTEISSMVIFDVPFVKLNLTYRDVDNKLYGPLVVQVVGSPVLPVNEVVTEVQLVPFADSSITKTEVELEVLDLTTKDNWFGAELKLTEVYSLDASNLPPSLPEQANDVL